MYTNNSCYNNNIVSTMTYTVFVIVIFMHKCVLQSVYINGYLQPLTNLATQTEFSQWGKVCSG